MSHHSLRYPGLTNQQVLESRAKHGFNKIELQKRHGFIQAALGLLKEPMFIMLLVASAIYFITGQKDDGFFMVSAILLVGAISFYQDTRSRNALLALRKMTQPLSRVIRNGKEMDIPSEEIVMDDMLIVKEGVSISADADIVQSHDFAVNESILTGESQSVYKSKGEGIYQGTTVISGLAIAKVSAIGASTRLGKIGRSLEQIEEEKTPLQIQINHFVRKMALAGGTAFLLVWVFHFYQTHQVMSSLLQALTLAMSVLPEEIPVAFTTFMALGAWRLMKLGIIVKQVKTVETLGSATVICVDKTGTITENKMSLARIYIHATKKISSPEEINEAHAKEVIQMAMWSSEPIPFDPMEVALHQAYMASAEKDERPDYKMVKEYALEGKPPMMTHIFENSAGHRLIAAKGAPEALMKVSKLAQEEKNEIEEVAAGFASEGYRVLGVGKADFAGEKFHQEQEHFTFRFIGLIGFHDPPKANIGQVLLSFYRAGVDVKIVTGDHTATTQSIAQQIGFRNRTPVLSGNDLMALDDEELKRVVNRTGIFTRMFPEAKLKVINALKGSGHIVAMTGDGVNDGPALKAAHIGIAMGRRGSEIAKRASALVLADDNLDRMVDAIAMGRKIYANLKKAIQYIISIHIPIILTVLLPLVFGWIYPSLFSPIHIIFLELIMGPTCSIIYENEPPEKDSMLQKPRLFSFTFFNRKEIATSIVQGLAITLGSLVVYQYCSGLALSEEVTRTMVFLVLISANVFLTLVNRSFYYSVVTTARYRNNLLPLMIAVTIGLTVLILTIAPLTSFFEFESLTAKQTGIGAGAGFVSVIWFEAVKAGKRYKMRKVKNTV